MQKAQNFSFSVKPTNSLTTMYTIGELDEVLDNRKNQNLTHKRNTSQGLSTLKSPKTTF